jgi:S-adenosylmethionine synthetase
MKASFIEAMIEEIIKPVLPKEWLQGHQVPDQPHRPLRHRRPAGRLRPDRPQDHRRHLRRRLPARRRRLQRQGPDQGGPLGRLRRALRGQEHRGRRPGAQCQIQVAYAIGVAKPMNITVYTEGTGVIPTSKIAALVQRALRPAPQGHHPDARPAAPHLREDRRLRPLRPRRARVHLGAHRQRPYIAVRCRSVSLRLSAM